MGKFKRGLMCFSLVISLLSPTLSFAEEIETPAPDNTTEITEESSQEEQNNSESVVDSQGEQILFTKQSSEPSPSSVEIDNSEITEENAEENSEETTLSEDETRVIIEEAPSIENVEEAPEEVIIPEEGLVEEEEEPGESVEEEIPEFEGVDFSSKRLLVKALDSSAFPEGTPIVSSLDDIYIVQYETEEETRKGYAYFLNNADKGFAVSVDTPVFALDEEGNGTIEDKIMTEEDNPFDAVKSELDGEVKETPKVKIALIDTGTVAGLANEYIDLTGSDTVYDENGHGTRMASLINHFSKGNAYIYSIKAFDKSGGSTSSIMYAAIRYAAEKNVDIINISASANDSTDADAFKAAVLKANSMGIKVIASAGNAHIDAASRIPSNIEGVITVTTVDEKGENIIGGYGRYIDYGVYTDSTSAATAIISGLTAAGELESHFGKEVFEINQDGEIAKYPLDEESLWTVDCSSVVFVRTAVEQMDGSYIAGPYSTVTGLAGATQVGAFTVYGPTPEWWEDGHTSSSEGGLNLTNQTGFYMDNMRKLYGDGFWTHSPEYNDLRRDGRPYRDATYSIYHDWASGKILGNFQIKDIRSVNPDYSYVGYHIEYYENDDQLGTSNSWTMEQARDAAASGTSFYYGNAKNVGRPQATCGSPSALKTGTTVNASMSNKAPVCGHASENSTNFYWQNAWRRIHITLVYNLNKPRYPLTINYLDIANNQPVATKHTSSRYEGITYSIPSPAVTGYRIVRDSEQPDVPGKTPTATTVTGTQPPREVVVNVYYEKTNLRLTKKWEGDIDKDSVNFVIKKPDGSIYKTVALTKAKGWTDTVNVDYGSTYSIYESGLNEADYTISCTAAKPCVISTAETKENKVVIRKAEISNRRTNEITVTKEWTEEAGDTSDRPESFKVHLINMNTKQDVLPAATLTAANGWSYTWKDVSIDIATINYGVWEEVPDLYDCPNFSPETAKAVTLLSGKKSLASVKLTNEYTPVFPKHKNVFNTNNVNIDKEIVKNGDTLKYVITFTNPTGMEKKFDIEDVIPQNSVFKSAENGGTLSGNKVSWASIAVPGKGTGSVTFYVTAVGSANNYVTIENTAQVWMKKKDGRRVITDKPDPETGIKSPNTETRYNYVPPTKAGPEGSIKSVTDVFNVDINTEYVEKSDNLYYHILINNGTPLNKTFTVTDKIPANTEFVSVGQYGTFANNTVTFVKEIPAKSRQEFTFVVKTLKDYSDIINIANVAVDHVNWDTNTVTNKTAKIVINKNISNYYEDFGKPSFTYEIKGSDGQVAYRMIELDNAVNGTAEFTVPRYTKDNVTFTVDEIRNGRYDFQSLGTDTPNTTILQNSLANIKFTEGNRLSVLNYQNIINEWDKDSHADSVTNKVRK